MKNKPSREEQERAQKEWDKGQSGANPPQGLIDIFDEVQKACFDTLEILEKRDYANYEWNYDTSKQIDQLVKVLHDNGVIAKCYEIHGLKVVEG